MNGKNRQGSIVTSVLAAGVFFLILSTFSKSMEVERDYSRVISSGEKSKETVMVIGSGSYQMNILEKAKYQFMPILADIE